MKLGKLAPKFHRLTLKFEDYLPVAAPAPPSKIYLEYKIAPDKIGMFGNDRLGICVGAMVAHQLMVITAHTGTMIVPTLQDVIDLYMAVGGYDPRQEQADGSNPTDNGMAITDAYDYWQKYGFCGHNIDGWAQIDCKDREKSRLALWMFLSIGVGIQCPAVAQTQFAAGQAFDVVDDDGGIEGGHAILETGEGSEGENVETWGKGDQKMTNAFGAKYADEKYIVLTKDLIDVASGRSPFGFDYDALTKALADMRT